MADLAIVRTDIGYPRSGATVAVMQTDHLILIAPKGRAGDRGRTRGQAVGLSGTTAETGSCSASSCSSRAIDPARVEAVPSAAGRTEDDVRAEAHRRGDDRRSHHEPAGLRGGERDRGDGGGRSRLHSDPADQRHRAAASADRGGFDRARQLRRAEPAAEKDTPTLNRGAPSLAAKSLSDATIARLHARLPQRQGPDRRGGAHRRADRGPDQEKASPIPIHPARSPISTVQTSTFLERYGDGSTSASWVLSGRLAAGRLGSASAGRAPASSS